MKTRILVVDDNESTVNIIKQALVKDGYKVFTASNGREGLDVIENNIVDLIITDVIMPEMDGVDFYKALKSSDRTKIIPIMIVTDNRVFRDSFTALGGVDDFCAKPVDTNEIRAKVQNLLSVIEEQKKKKKILILGEDNETCESMKTQLEQSGHTAIQAKNSIELIMNSLVMVPDIILIDVLMKDIPSKETIAALKCFVKLIDTKILAYTHFDPEELTDVETVDQIKDAKDACVKAGSTKYIGRYTRTTFINNFYEYW